MTALPPPGSMRPDSLARRRQLTVLALYPAYLLGFQYVERVVPVAEYVMHNPLDDLIPFVPMAIYPYLSWYLYIAIGIGVTGLRDPRGYYQLLWTLYLGMGISYVIYLAFPNGQELRPPLTSLGAGVDHDLIRWLYRVDTPRNSNPSMHVIDSMAVYLVLRRDRLVSRRLPLRAANLGLNVLIIASTVLVKQHSIVDVVCGLGMSALLYWAIMGRELPFVPLGWGRAPLPFLPGGRTPRAS